jgi:hypothetical protein
MIINIDGIRINSPEIYRYEKIYCEKNNTRPIVKISFVARTPNSPCLMNVPCNYDEHSCDEFLRLLDDAFADEVAYISIFTENLRMRDDEQF